MKDSAAEVELIVELVLVVVLLRILNSRSFKTVDGFPMVLEKQTVHKLTVNVPEVLATADVERDRLVVANLVMGDAQVHAASAR